jgi:hypothetical protein
MQIAKSTAKRKNEKRKMEKEKGKRSRLPAREGIIRRMPWQKLRITNCPWGDTLPLNPYTLNPFPGHRRSTKNTIQSRRDAYHFVVAQFNQSTIQLSPATDNF